MLKNQHNPVQPVHFFSCMARTKKTQSAWVGQLLDQLETAKQTAPPSQVKFFHRQNAAYNEFRVDARSLTGCDVEKIIKKNSSWEDVMKFIREYNSIEQREEKVSDDPKIWLRIHALLIARIVSRMANDPVDRTDDVELRMETLITLFSEISNVNHLGDHVTHVLECRMMKSLNQVFQHYMKLTPKEQDAVNTFMYQFIQLAGTEVTTQNGIELAKRVVTSLAGCGRQVSKAQMQSGLIKYVMGEGLSCSRESCATRMPWLNDTGRSVDQEAQKVPHNIQGHPEYQFVISCSQEGQRFGVAIPVDVDPVMYLKRALRREILCFSSPNSDIPTMLTSRNDIDFILQNNCTVSARNFSKTQKRAVSKQVSELARKRNLTNGIPC